MIALAERLLEARPVPKTAPPSVREVLADLGIQPFTAESVASYKAAQVAKHRPPLWHRVLGFIDRHLGLETVALNLLVGFIMFFLTGVITIVLEFLTDVSVALGFWEMVVGAVGALAIFVWAPTILGRPIKEPARWQLALFYRYGEVPLPVSRTAELVRRRLPAGELLVDELVQHEYRLDPFLVLRHEGEDYYLAVWDETDFDDDAAHAS